MDSVDIPAYSRAVEIMILVIAPISEKRDYFASEIAAKSLEIRASKIVGQVAVDEVILNSIFEDKNLQTFFSKSCQATALFIDKFRRSTNSACVKKHRISFNFECIIELIKKEGKDFFKI